MQKLAPIALFVYNRPDHTERTLTFLKRNELAIDSRLFIFSDGAKNADDAEQVAEVRALIRNVEGFKSVEVVLQKENLGLANSIIAGVTRLVNDYEQVVVFEDDLITSPYTLQYFNSALEVYREKEQVMHIGAYMYPLGKTELPQTFFYRAATSWGWATWKRAWENFNPDIDNLIQQFDARKRSEFSIEHTMNFWKQMQEFKRGRNNSWAIRWYASIFLKGGLTLNPSHSMVNNIGHDGTGVHSGINDIFNVIIDPKPITWMPAEVKENAEAYQAIKDFLKNRKGSLWARVKRFIREKVLSPKS